MDWQSLKLSLSLALWTCVVIAPIAVFTARWLAFGRGPARFTTEALIALPLVLPPTVLGYYLLVSFGGDSPLGQIFQSFSGQSLAFTFEGLVVASVIFNLPFAIQPMQRALEGIAPEIREAAWCCGMSRWRTFWLVELPLSWRGFVSAFVLTFVHTLGEFGVVLMIGGNIPGETRTVSIAIYDRVQAFDDQAAGVMSAVLLGVSFLAILIVFGLTGRRSDRHV